MGPIGKDLSVKENTKPAPSVKTFMNVFRPIREWLQQTRQPKTSTPISAPILRSSSANGHLRQQTGNAVRNSNTLNVNRINSSNSNSYGGDSLTGSSGDMLSSSNPTPTHQLQHQQHHSTLQNPFVQVPNGHNGTLGDADQGRGGCGGGGGGGSMLNSLEDQLNGSLKLDSTTEVSGMGSTLEMNQQFSRTAQARMSLPIMQQNKLRRQAYSQLQRRGQNQVARSMGHIYLQHKGETKQASLPNELTTIDTIRALFVCAFPHMLTMEYMSQPHVKIYIYNPSCNIFYELCDIEEVRHESVLRIHHSDPLGPFTLTSQVSMASLGGLPVTPLAHPVHNPYSTLHRAPPRLPPQMMPPILRQQQQQQSQNRSQLEQQNQSQHQQQPQQQQQQRQPQQQPQPVQPSTPVSIGPPLPQALMMPHHMMQQQVMMQPLQQQQHFQQQQQLPQYHRTIQGPPMQQLSQIPPPKPRRMIPASYSLHRLPPHPSQ